MLGVTNVFEDIRIERQVREKYRGLTGTFSRGYQSLLTREFFGVPVSELTPEKVAQRQRLDRINLYAKIGGVCRLTLSDAQDAAWFNRALAATTYDQIMSLVSDVMEQLSDEQRQQAAQNAQQGQSQQGQGQNGQGSSQPSNGQQNPNDQNGQSQNGQPSNGATTANGDADATSKVGDDPFAVREADDEGRVTKPGVGQTRSSHTGNNRRK